MVTKIIIPVTSALHFSQEKKNYYVVIAPVAKLPFDKLPLDANLRRANQKAKTVRAMISTLLEKPGNFLDSNLGIVLIAESAHFKYSVAGDPIAICVEMLSGLHGVANGAHTLAAIYQAHQAKADLSAANVVIRVNVGVTDDNVKDAVVNLNTAEKVDRRSILNKSGKLDDIKAGLAALGYNQITFYQNEAASENRQEATRQSVVQVIKLLTLIDKQRCNPDLNQHPSFVMGGGSGVLQDNVLNRADDLILSFLPMLIKIDNAICKKVAASPGKLPGVKKIKEGDKLELMTDGTPIACGIPSAFSFPVIAAFRAFVEDDEWQIPIDQKEVFDDVIDKLWVCYSGYLRKEWLKENRNLGGILRNNAVWGYLYNMAFRYYNEYLKKLVSQNGERNGRAPEQPVSSKTRR